VVVAIGNPALRQTWQQVLEQVAACCIPEQS
jgi:hypothetical protein